MKGPALLLLPILIFGIVLVSCSKKSQPVVAEKNEAKVSPKGTSMALPPCIIYKTKADYRTNVPVSLSDDKTRITSYPDVSDIRKQANSVNPQELSGGYLLDNRGIGPDVAFLSITYQDYIKQAKTPSADDLFRQLLDQDPLLEMYQCGNRHQYKDIIRELNDKIDSGFLSDCKKIK